MLLAFCRLLLTQYLICRRICKASRALLHVDQCNTRLGSSPGCFPACSTALVSQTRAALELCSFETPQSVWLPKELKLPCWGEILQECCRAGLVWRREDSREASLLSPNTWKELEPGGDGLFSQATSNSFKLHQEWFGLDFRKNWFIGKVDKHWEGLPREAVESPALEGFKAQVDVARPDTD